MLISHATNAVRCRKVLAILAGILSIFILFPTISTSKNLSEYEVKAAYIFNFAKFTQWPEIHANKNLLTMCIVGEDPFGMAMDELNNKKVQGKTFKARSIRQEQDLNTCDILFISTSEKWRIKQVIKAVSNFNILTVSDIPGFAHYGGIIELVSRNNRIMFDINIDASKRAGLKISANLLKIANVVKDKDIVGDKK